MMTLYGWYRGRVKTENVPQMLGTEILFLGIWFGYFWACGGWWWGTLIAVGIPITAWLIFGAIPAAIVATLNFFETGRIGRSLDIFGAVAGGARVPRIPRIVGEIMLREQDKAVVPCIVCGDLFISKGYADTCQRCFDQMMQPPPIEPKPLFKPFRRRIELDLE